MIQIYTYGSPSLVKTTSSSIGRMRVPFDDPTQTQLLKSKRPIIAPSPVAFLWSLPSRSTRTYVCSLFPSWASFLFHCSLRANSRRLSRSRWPSLNGPLPRRNVRDVPATPEARVVFVLYKTGCFWWLSLSQSNTKSNFDVHTIVILSHRSNSSQIIRSCTFRGELWDTVQRSLGTWFGEIWSC